MLHVQILEEDLIFPAGNDSIKHTEFRPSTTQTRPLLDLYIPQTDGTSTSSKASNSSLSKSPTTSRFTSAKARFHTETDSRQSPNPEIRVSSPYPLLSISDLLDPRDHSKLKAAWDAMLHKRFLPPGLLSVLHFYFSAEFEDVQSHPAIRIVMPSNSQMTFDDGLSSTRGRSLSLSSAVSAVSKASYIPAVPVVWNSSDYGIDGYGLKRGDVPVTGPVLTTSLAAMHLSKVVSTVRGCKEAIWPEYIELEGPLEDDDKMAEVRKEFLAAWDHWERYAHLVITVESCPD